MDKDDVRIIHKTREDYNRIAKYFSGTRMHIWNELKFIEQYIKNGDVVLDWGCGNGRMVTLLKDKKIEYVGIDQSDELLVIAKKLFAQEIKDGWVQFFSNATEEKQFLDSFFDVVLMIASFHHLPSHESRLNLLTKTYKEMKRGGTLIIAVWNLESEWAKAKINKNWKMIGENDFLIPWKNPQGEILAERYYHHFSKEELKNLLEESGFTIRQLEFSEQATTSDKKGGRNLIAIAIK
jgi:ubiquinone/menaquinone biosynthesis C-methylase UbiE